MSASDAILTQILTELEALRVSQQTLQAKVRATLVSSPFVVFLMRLAGRFAAESGQSTLVAPAEWRSHYR